MPENFPEIDGRRLSRKTENMVVLCFKSVTNGAYTTVHNRKERRLPAVKILIVEDEEMIARLIRIGLEKAGYSCECVYDGKAAADLLEEKRYDLILLDIMLPEIDGYELLEYIREFEIPVIFITAKSSLEDKVKGLRAGADDYITKPFELAELTARVESVLRRYHKGQDKIKLAGLDIDMESRTVKRDGTEIELTMKELELLQLFLRNRNIALFRDRIYEEVWGGEYDPESRTVDVHIQRLKKKLDLEGVIVSVRKIGYRLEADKE